MLLIPAIDIKDGRCVMLKRGSALDVTDYGDPVEMAEHWVGLGARMLHVIDLDAAFTGKRTENSDIIREIAKRVDVPIQSGGGLRTMRDMEERLSLGVTRIILGTVALENPDLVEQACKMYPGRIVCAVDAKDGKVATRGWLSSSDVEPVELALSMKNRGVQVIIFTDTQRDGMMAGPNIDSTRQMVLKCGMRIIASGGISSADDIMALQNAGCTSAVLGSAIYSGKISFGDVLKEDVLT